MLVFIFFIKHQKDWKIVIFDVITFYFKMFLTYVNTIEYVYFASSYYIYILIIILFPAFVFSTFNTLRPRQNGRHFADVIFRCIFLNENARISLKISLRFVPKVRINSIPALVQILAWRRPGDKPLSEPMMVSLLAHICVTRPQWVKFILTYQHDLNNDYV